MAEQLQDSEQTEDKNEDIDPALGIRSHGLPEWLEGVTENLVDEGASAKRNTPRSTSRDSDSETFKKVVSGRHSIFTPCPKDLQLRSMQEDQNDKGFLHKAHW